MAGHRSPVDPLIEAITLGVVEKLREGQAGEFCDQKSAPIPRALYLRAARDGAFPSFRVKGYVLARRADVVAWIEKHQQTPSNEARDAVPARAAVEEQPACEPTVDERAAARWGVELAKGGKR